MSKAEMIKKIDEKLEELVKKHWIPDENRVNEIGRKAIESLKKMRQNILNEGE